MPEPVRIDELRCELKLNGVPVKSVGIRGPSDFHEDLEIVVIEPALGSFALHDGFEIEVREPNSTWRQVTLNELRAMLKETSLLAVGDLPTASAIAECRLFARVEGIEVPQWESSLRSVLGRQEACVRYVQRLFYGVRIPHLVAGTVFSVPSVPTARIQLKRAGFRQSEISSTALVEPKTGCAVQLVERDPRK
jgi:hypothetical protein